MGVDEALLIQGVVKGDESAYRSLLQVHLKPISNYVMRMMNNSAEAEDIIQETFLRLWTHAASYNTNLSGLTTWLHNIAHNLCIDHFRKNNRLVDEETMGENDTIGPDHTLDQDRTRIEIGKAMMLLPERQRSAIIMCHYQGLSNKAAAQILNLSVDALESLLARGRLRLRTLLGEHHEQ